MEVKKLRLSNPQMVRFAAKFLVSDSYCISLSAGCADERTKGRLLLRP
jgi:hypothetical protein